MIDLYTWRTPNGRKANVMVEELGIPYELHPINIGQGDQRKPEYLAINPNGKIPSIVDRDGYGGQPLPVFESGAILIYLAEKTGKLMPQDPRRRMEALQWLMFQMGGVGPMFGQAGHFMRASEQIPYAIKRYTDEGNRLLNVLEKRLATNEYLAGDYSIADIAMFPWVMASENLKLNIAGCPNVRRWLDSINARPAVQRGIAMIK